MVDILRQRWIWGALLLAIGMAVVGVLFYQLQLFNNQSDPASARSLGQPIPVRTALVVEKDVEQVVGGTAMTVPSESAIIEIGSFSAGQGTLVVKAVNVKEGSPVRVGEVMVECEDDLFRTKAQERELELASAKASADVNKEKLANKQKLRTLNLASAEAEFKFQKEEVETRRLHQEETEILYKKEKTARSATDYYDARSKYGSARSKQVKAEHDLVIAKQMMDSGPLEDAESLAKTAVSLAAAKDKLVQSQKDLKECQVKSPLNGIVDVINLVPGMRIKPATPLTHVLQTDPIFVKMDFPQERLGEVAFGQPAEVVLDSFPGETFTGSVDRIGAQVHTKLRVLSVYLKVANAKQRIRAGVTGFARVRLAKKALVVPTAAITSHGNKAMVFRVQDGKARIREVRTGPPVDAGLLEVYSGLAAGDEVVIYSNFYINAGNLIRDEAYLQDNDPVDVNWRKWTSRND